MVSLEEDNTPIVLKGYYRSLRNLVITSLLFVVLPFLISILVFSQRSKNIVEMLGDAAFWGLPAIFFLSTALPMYLSIFFFTIDRCELYFYEDVIVSKTYQYLRKARVKKLRYAEIDWLSFRYLREKSYILRISKNPTQVRGGGKHRIWCTSSGFTQDDFITILELINTKILNGIIKKESVQSVPWGSEIFGETNKKLRDILKRKYTSGEIRERNK